jgi:hypothetical protein
VSSLRSVADVLAVALDPVSDTGALRNAAGAVEVVQRAGALRRAVAVVQARALSPAAWCALPGGSSTGPPHAVDLYRDEADLVGRLVAYVLDGLVAGETCVVLATAAHCTGLRQRLAVLGVTDVPGQLVTLGADRALAALVRDGRPRPELFGTTVGALLRRHLATGAALRVYGELAGLLDARGDVEGADELERLWEPLRREGGFPLLCGYADGDPSACSERHQQVLTAHSHVLPPGV